MKARQVIAPVTSLSLSYCKDTLTKAGLGLQSIVYAIPYSCCCHRVNKNVSPTSIK